MMIKTKNDLPEATRVKICGILNQNLAEAVDLVYQAKQAHWNVKGSQFKSLHELFDEVAEAAEKYVDEFAERIVQLGGSAEGTIRASVQKSTLPEYPLGIISANEHVETLGSRVSQFGKNVRACIGVCGEAGDLVTADIYTDATKDADKLTWMLESHLVEASQLKPGERPKVA